MTNAWKNFIENVKLRRFTVLLLNIVVLWLMRSMMNLILFYLRLFLLILLLVG